MKALFTDPITKTGIYTFKKADIETIIILQRFI